MLNGKTVLAVVPARGGSKGIPRKNLCLIEGKPLVAMVGEVLEALSELDRVIVSTDDEEIAAVAEAAGIAAPFLRPNVISGDTISDLDVLTHALQAMEDIDDTIYDVVLMLQPTSPLRKASDVRNCLRKLIDDNLDSVWTVSETDSKNHPMKQLTLGPNGELNFYDPNGEQIIARQQLKPTFHRNGIAYAISRDCLLKQRSIKGRNSVGLVIDGHHVSIDTLWDLSLVEYIFSCRNGEGAER